MKYKMNTIMMNPTVDVSNVTLNKTMILDVTAF